MTDIEIIDAVISTLYDDYEQEQEYAQKVISAWIRIKHKLEEEDFEEDFEQPWTTSIAIKDPNGDKWQSIKADNEDFFVQEKEE